MKPVLILFCTLAAVAVQAATPPPPPSPTLALTAPDPYEVQVKPFRLASPERAIVECTAIRMKFGRSNLDENIFGEMVRAIAEIIGKLKLEIVDFRHDE